MAESKSELEEALFEFKKLEKNCIAINVRKSQIMTNRTDMVGITEVAGIEIQESIRYLGMNLFCDRQKTIKSIKSQV